ncbi:hypothetical protein BDQ17DRAFT_1362023 [Cyathus striatus]|nr:hypothetical protein BDQ17DRAFT_1362023 [Cyathus striatus]
MFWTFCHATKTAASPSLLHQVLRVHHSFIRGFLLASYPLLQTLNRSSPSALPLQTISCQMILQSLHYVLGFLGA